jgi:hypothetical protein
MHQTLIGLATIACTLAWISTDWYTPKNRRDRLPLGFLADLVKARAEPCGYSSNSLVAQAGKHSIFRRSLPNQSRHEAHQVLR